ncbi:hypothetical protein ADIARSV_1412 [Arcticibacter svalbardensis MN12-7]|uniref:Uncharacterized protein n=1 Tax=Arcticibacter svalbardensis MN12-7 TaxID=1150600 RepID=R9GUK2_9SPHI|nr:hypothetical protein ADIARSV_1412 [Arcticibacter svalbardensis MN12-7]
MSLGSTNANQLYKISGVTFFKLVNNCTVSSFNQMELF